MTAARTERPVAMVDLCVTEKLDLACLSDAGLAFDDFPSLGPGHVVVETYRRLHIYAVGGLQLDVDRQLARRHALLSPRAPNARNRRILQVGGVDRTDCGAGWPVTGHRNCTRTEAGT